MKSVITKAILKELELKNRARKVLTSRRGNILTDHAGLTVVGIVLILAVLVWAVSFVNKTFLPTLGQKIMGILDYNG